MWSRADKLLLLVAFAALIASGSAAQAQGVSGQEVAAAIQKGIAHLRSTQKGDGSWPEAQSYRGGITALSLLAMLNANVPPDDPAVARGLAYLARVSNERTYVVALKAQVFAACGLQKYRKNLDAAARWLVHTQLDNGMWGYGPRRARGRRIVGRGDNSNTQFALLGLHEAAKAGYPVPKDTWRRSRLHFQNTQLPDGGWTYAFRANMRNARGRPPAYGSMSAAAVASLYICGQQLYTARDRRFINGVYPNCGRYQTNKALKTGLHWLANRFSVRENPGRGSAWLLYYLYALERVGMVSGQRSFGRHDWYREGAAYLVGAQSPNGSWRTGQGRTGGADTTFALLFLAKGNRPVLIQKVQWNGLWNRNIHDLENLTSFIGDKFGKRTTWQTTSLDLPVRELRQSPILFITGHTFPRFTDAQKETLRRFVESGGTLLFEACCGMDSFEKGFRAFAEEIFDKYPLRKVTPDHPVMRSFYNLDETYGLEGIDVGCRTGVFFSPRALGALWELKTIPRYSQLAFKLGTNIAAYATGREQLPDKLDVVNLPEQSRAAGQIAEVPRGAVRIARLIHNGDYGADPNCMVNLAAMLRDQAKIDVVAKARHLRPEDPKVYEYPILVMTGHYSFAYSDKQIEALRKYLDRGGCLIADACCGQKAFDKSFREMAAKLYPNNALKRIAATHPIIAGQVGTPLGELSYRKILADQLKQRGTTHPIIEAVVIEGRTAILYSKYDFTCALEGDRPYSCRGYNDDSGRKLALNLFLYAITY